jgi:hypothetical protein
MPTPKPAKAFPVPDFPPIADELGALEKKMAAHEAEYAAQHGVDLARIEQLREALRNGCTALAGEPWTVIGKKFTAVLGPCSLKRVIDFRHLVKIIGAPAFAMFATCTLKEIRARCLPPVIASVVKLTQTGPRDLTTHENR